MNGAEQVQLRQLLDREAIRECVHAYCRGVDRRDEEALRSAFWPDAMAYGGAAAGFIKSALRMLKEAPRMVHMIGNISIVLKGDSAAVESYFQAFQHDRDPAGQSRATLLCGRYVDRFEKRGDEWRVALRTGVFDWIRETPGLEGDDASNFGVRNPNGQQKPQDPWYALLASS